MFSFFRHVRHSVEDVLCKFKELGITIGITVAIVSDCFNEVLFLGGNLHFDCFFLLFHTISLFEQCKDTTFLDSNQKLYYLF